jgi:predicted metalloprotease
VGGRGVGLGTIAIALVAGWIFGINPMAILGALSGGGDLAAPSARAPTVPRSGKKPTDGMAQARGRMSEREREHNGYSVRLELQADCFAGIWAHHNNQSKQILEPGDIEEALKAATAIGDDTLQRKSQGAVVPDSFTHGTSAQRQRWFTTGLQSGQIQICDTFSARQL